MTITSRYVRTARLSTFVREAGAADAPVLVLVHGNVSSSVFFEPLMETLADRFRLVAPDFRGYGDSERLPIDATRGMRDFSDDLAALLQALEITAPVDLLGWSAGGGVVMQLAIDHSDHVRRLVLEAGMSPYGFGGSMGPDGRPTAEDFAGSGGGTANPDFVARLKEGDRGADAASPLTTLRSFYVRPGFELEPEAERRYLHGMLATSVGDDVYPGDATDSPNWPGTGPGTTGMNNALSPAYCDLSPFADLDPAPPVLWIRGADDQIVSDTSFFDPGFLGQVGALPGWPGPDVFPPQPMVTQLRTVLERSGAYTETVYESCGHSPHLELPDRFAADVRSFLS
jgi:pimeloyl-ACP methyl ester carboxylesterase